MTVCASIGLPSIATPRSSTCVTGVPSITSTPIRFNFFRVLRASDSGKVASILGAASIRIMRAEFVSICRKSEASALCASSAIAPAISTPVGPAPTSTNVSSSCTFCGSVSISAASKASKMSRRIDVASIIDFSPGASCSHSGCPK